MSDEIVNRDWLPGNDCFGCGHDNPHGLKLEIRRDSKNDQRLVASFRPPDYLIGFPGITHGGGIYTAMDCLAAWTPAVLRRGIRAIWILRSASIKYLRAARQGEELDLSATIGEEGVKWEPIIVRTEARDKSGNLLSTGKFKVVPLTAERFKEVSGLPALPSNWSDFLGETGD